MSAGSLRILGQTGLAAVVSTALAAVVNLATDSAAKPWLWAAVVVLTGASWLAAYWSQRRSSDPAPGVEEARTGRSPDVQQTVSDTTARAIVQIGHLSIGSPGRWATAIVGLVLLGGVLLSAFPVERPRSPDPPPPVTETSGPPSPDADVTMHEIWASSSGNVSVDVPDRSWVMTDFVVTLPYVRSIEIGAAPSGFGGSSNGATVQLRILDAHGQEIDGGDTTIDRYRAKYVFSHAVDVHAYLNQHLYLQLKNISGKPIRSFFTINDRNPAITSYVPCDAPIPTLCPNPQARDLDALVIGRTGTW